MTRGGLFTDPIVEHDQFILGESGVLEQFKASQLLLQADAIQQDGLGLNQLFNTIQFDANLNPGIRVYRHGLVGLPVPRYAPQPGPNINPDGLLGLFNIDLTGIENAISDNLAGNIPYEDIGKGTPKILGLYNTLMLHQTPETTERGGFLGGLLNTLQTSAPILFEDPYPIVPSINVVNSPSTFDGINQVYHKDSIYGSDQDYEKPTGKGNLFGLNLVSEKYDFFSKSKPTIFKIRQDTNREGTKSKFADIQDKKIDSLGSKPNKPLELKIEDRIPLAVGGKDYDVRPTIEATPFQQIDKKLNRGIDGALDKFSTLSYGMLGAKDNADQVDPGGAKSLMYDQTLRSPSEINLTALANVGGDGNPREGTQEIEESVNALSGPRGDQYLSDNLGARDHYQKKVYAIGRQGIRAVLRDTSKRTNDAEPFRGVIKKGGAAGDKFISDAVDRVNILPYGGNITQEKGNGPTAKDLHNSSEEFDFIPLVFEDVYNKKSIVFRSILGDITDTITPDWSSKEYIGRAQKAAVYKGVGRTIGFNFSVYPKTKQEFPVLLEKVNYLVGQCYPNLDKNLRQTGPMIRLTIGDILYKQLGYITGCTVTFPNTSTWELDRGLRFTKLIQVQIDYTHIGGYIPVATGKHYGLPWLKGSQATGGNVKFDNYPNREDGGSGGEAPPDAITNYRPVFQELGQQIK